MKFIWEWNPEIPGIQASSCKNYFRLRFIHSEEPLKKPEPPLVDWSIHWLQNQYQNLVYYCMSTTKTIKTHETLAQENHKNQNIRQNQETEIEITKKIFCWDFSSLNQCYPFPSQC